MIIEMDSLQDSASNIMTDEILSYDFTPEDMNSKYSFSWMENSNGFDEFPSNGMEYPPTFQIDSSGLFSPECYSEEGSDTDLFSETDIPSELDGTSEFESKNYESSLVDPIGNIEIKQDPLSIKFDIQGNDEVESMPPYPNSLSIKSNTFTKGIDTTNGDITSNGIESNPIISKDSMEIEEERMTRSRPTKKRGRPSKRNEESVEESMKVGTIADDDSMISKPKRRARGNKEKENRKTINKKNNVPDRKSSSSYRSSSSSNSMSKGDIGSKEGIKAKENIKFNASHSNAKSLSKSSSPDVKVAKNREAARMFRLKQQRELVQLKESAERLERENKEYKDRIEQLRKENADKKAYSEDLVKHLISIVVLLRQNVSEKTLQQMDQTINMFCKTHAVVL